MSVFDWRQKGRELATSLLYDTYVLEWWRTQATEALARHLLTAESADLLGAVRWTATRECGCEERGKAGGYDFGPCRTADKWESEALRLLVEGFRSKLSELAGERA